MRLDAIAMPSKSGAPSASSRAAFDQLPASAAFRASAAAWQAVWPVDVACDEVGDEERPTLGALAHGDVGAEEELGAVGRRDHGVDDGQLDRAGGQRTGVGRLVGPRRIDRVEARRLGDDGDSAVTRGCDVQHHRVCFEGAVGVGDERVARGEQFGLRRRRCDRGGGTGSRARAPRR
jgi:hypothetical protein